MTWRRLKPRAAVHGAAHARARRELAAQHQPEHPCVRCGYPLGPMGPHLHLDHHDHDKTVYLGFSHAACNLRAASDRGRQQQRLARLEHRSRDW